MTAASVPIQGMSMAHLHDDIAQMRVEYSDLHKEVFGCRPDREHINEVLSMSDTDFVNAYDQLFNLLTIRGAI